MIEHLKRMQDKEWINYLSSPNKCEVCGKHIEKSKYNNKYLCSSECYAVDFWEDKYQEYISDDDLVVVIDSHMYRITKYTNKYIDGVLIKSKPQKKSVIKGYGGFNFKIARNDGALFEISDLWHNGEIPEGLRNKMPNNAVFVKQDIKELSIDDFKV